MEKSSIRHDLVMANLTSSVKQGGTLGCGMLTPHKERKISVLCRRRHITHLHRYYYTDVKNYVVSSLYFKIFHVYIYSASLITRKLIAVNMTLTQATSHNCSLMDIMNTIIKI